MPVLLQSAVLPKLKMFVLHVTPPGRQEQPVQAPVFMPAMIVNWSVKPFGQVEAVETITPIRPPADGSNGRHCATGTQSGSAQSGSPSQSSSRPLKQLSAPVGTHGPLPPLPPTVPPAPPRPPPDVPATLPPVAPPPSVPASPAAPPLPPAPAFDPPVPPAPVIASDQVKFSSSTSQPLLSAPRVSPRTAMGVPFAFSVTRRSTCLPDGYPCGNVTSTPPARAPGGLTGSDVVMTSAPSTETPTSIAVAAVNGPRSTCRNRVPGRQLASLSQAAPANVASANRPIAAALRSDGVN